MSNQNPIQVALCDDHQIMREGLKKIINSSDDMEVTLDVADGESLLQQLSHRFIDVIVLDVSLPAQNGIEILSQIHQDYPKLPVIILSMYPEEELAIRAFKAGASGYLHKDSAPQNLIEAIFTVHKGQRYLSPAASKLFYQLVTSEDRGPAHNKLSAREYEVMLAVGKGYTTKEIGNQLNVSVKTVSTYRGRVFQKLELNSNAQLVSYLLRHHLLHDANRI